MKMSPNVFEINEDEVYKLYVVVNFMQCSKKKIRTSKTFAGPVDAMCYWSYRASIILS